MKTIVTMQDLSCFGKCSAAVALPVLSALGVETSLLPTAVLSTHTGFDGARIRDLTDFIPDILEHWQEQGISFDASYTGYLSDMDQFKAADRLMKGFVKPGGLRFCDPVLGDHGKLYRGFDGNSVQCMKKLITGADFVFPNLTELCLLTDSPYPEGSFIQNEEMIRRLCRALSSFGPRYIVLTGAEDDEGHIGALLCERRSDGSFSFTEVLSEKQPGAFPGTGDLYCSAFIGFLLGENSLPGSGSCRNDALPGETPGSDSRKGGILRDERPERREYIRADFSTERFCAAARFAADFVSDCIRDTLDSDGHSSGVIFEKALRKLFPNL